MSRPILLGLIGIVLVCTIPCTKANANAHYAVICGRVNYSDSDCQYVSHVVDAQIQACASYSTRGKYNGSPKWNQTLSQISSEGNNTDNNSSNNNDGISGWTINDGTLSPGGSAGLSDWNWNTTNSSSGQFETQQQGNNSYSGGRRALSCNCFLCNYDQMPNGCKELGGYYCAAYGCSHGCACRRRRREQQLMSLNDDFGENNDYDDDGYYDDDAGVVEETATNNLRGLYSSQSAKSMSWQWSDSDKIANECTAALQALATQLAEMSPPNNCLGDNASLTCFASAFT